MIRKSTSIFSTKTTHLLWCDDTIFLWPVLKVARRCLHLVPLRQRSIRSPWESSCCEVWINLHKQKYLIMWGAQRKIVGTVRPHKIYILGLLNCHICNLYVIVLHYAQFYLQYNASKRWLLYDLKKSLSWKAIFDLDSKKIIEC